MKDQNLIEMAKRCQIGLTIQIAEAQLNLTKYFGQ